MLYICISTEGNVRGSRQILGIDFHVSLLDLEGLAVQMVDMYCKSLPLSKDLDIQENMHGEELLSMTCNVLVQVFMCFLLILIF